MKLKIVKYACLLVGIVGLVHLIGCATPNPAAVQNPQTGAYSAPPYVVNPYIGSVSNTAWQAAQALAPMNPYAGITNWLITGGGTLAGVIGGLFAGYKNRNAVVTSMAQSVAQAGVHAQVLDVAASTPHFASIAGAINDALAPSQNPSGKPSA